MKNTQLSFFALALIFFLGCDTGKNATEIHEVRNENGVLVESYERRKSDFAKQGSYTKFYPDGKTIMEQTTYENDTINGEFIRFYENGNKMNIATIVNGTYHGPFKEFYESGQLMQEFSYENGVMTGLVKGYFENGKLKEEVQFANNQENGSFVEYHPTGRKAFEGTYLNGKENGELLKYDETGELIRKLDCVNGLCATTWKKEGVED